MLNAMSMQFALEGNAGAEQGTLEMDMNAFEVRIINCLVLGTFYAITFITIMNLVFPVY